MLVWRKSTNSFVFVGRLDTVMYNASFVEFIHTHKHALNPVLSVNQYCEYVFPFFYYSTACNYLCIFQAANQEYLAYFIKRVIFKAWSLNRLLAFLLWRANRALTNDSVTIRWITIKIAVCSFVSTQLVLIFHYVH